jgi:hypothetical protein
MKITIDIPEDTIASIVRDLALRRINEILREWALSGHAKGILLEQWKAVEERIIANVFNPPNIDHIERQAVERISRSLIGRVVRHGKQQAKQELG